MNEYNELDMSVIQFVGSKPEGRLKIGCGLASQVGKEAANITQGKILLVVDPTIHRLGVDEKIIESVDMFGLQYTIFSDVEPEPTEITIDKLSIQIKNEKYGCVIGLGGGSALDTAKLGALLAVNDMNASELFAAPDKIKGCLPTILMPTTSGTGSEVSPYIVMSLNHKKSFIGSPYSYATLAIVDPLLTVTMPPKVTAFCGLDALTHGIEGAMGKTTPYTLAMARECARLVFKYLPRAVADGNDIEARYYMSYAAVLGMFAYTQGGGLYAHSMSYILTAECNLPHGGGCGLALPYMLDFCRDFIEPVNEMIRDVSGKQDVVQAVSDLIVDIGAPITLNELKIEEHSLERMAHALIEEYHRPRNPREMKLEDALELMKKMKKNNNK